MFLKPYLEQRKYIECALGNLLLNIRTRNGLTRELVEDHTGICRKSIGNLEKGYDTLTDRATQLFHYYYDTGLGNSDDIELYYTIVFNDKTLFNLSFRTEELC